MLHEENPEVPEESEDLWSDEAEEDDPEPANSLGEIGLHIPGKTGVKHWREIARTDFNFLRSDLVDHEERGALADHPGSDDDNEHHRHGHVLEHNRWLQVTREGLISDASLI